MARRSILESARVARGLTQEAVARRSGTSQPTLSAYERGTKSPTLAVVERILYALGYDLTAVPRVSFRAVPIGRRTYLVPDRLWRIDPEGCFTPLTIRDRDRNRHTFDLANRDSRIAAYAWLILHGDEAQLIEHLDAALLVDAWSDLRVHLPEPLRTLWGPLVRSVAEAGVDELLISGLRAGRPKPISPRARARAIEALAAHGLTADEIRAVLPR